MSGGRPLTCMEHCPVGLLMGGVKSNQGQGGVQTKPSRANGSNGLRVQEDTDVYNHKTKPIRVLDCGFITSGACSCVNSHGYFSTEN